jgi:hypothetical protein
MAGNKKGKGMKVSAAEVTQIVNLSNSGKTVAEIMKITGRGRTAVMRWIERAGVEYHLDRQRNATATDPAVVTEAVAQGIESHSGYNSSVFLQATNTVLPFEENNTAKSSPTQAISEASTASDGFGMLQQIYDESSVQLELLLAAHDERWQMLKGIKGSLEVIATMMGQYAVDIERLSKIKSLTNELVDAHRSIVKLESDVIRLTSRTARLEGGLKA